ncbi:DNA ligase D [Solibacillus sp. R5-41]|uniref:DNA ligase D n=1 Tax=Solibacillus sp. R5-41 TaxID=2048654 RepID=UPI000C129652|nr:DNA ligase D [Solibacillus sp. R5-41]ATP39952.1 DNA ligase D [Solibacillus sp. R5-41]
MKPMLLTDSNEIPMGDEWLYETKYDGFRCTLEWVEKVPILKSRNDNELNKMFPEIIAFCNEIYESIKAHLPLFLDGELVYLVNNIQSNFSIVQQRGRMRNKEVITEHARKFPCHYVVFDLLKYRGEDQFNRYITTRKQILDKLFRGVQLPIKINYENTKRLQSIDVFVESEDLWNSIKIYNGEGMIAKKKMSKWLSDTRSKNWLKIKNWRFVSVIVFKYDTGNGYFSGGVYQDDNLIEIVTFKHGLREEEMKTLITFFQSNGRKVNETISVEPSVCVDIACIDFDGSKLREPQFHVFRFDLNPDQCIWQQMQRQLQPIPEAVQVTHPNKPVWPIIGINKDEYLLYLQTVAPHMMPFLRDRLLTVIRFPHGALGESFYQKNSPDNIPEFVSTEHVEGTNFILCNNIETLLWLGNQLALEFHIPFQTMNTEKPSEIVFDLDPPSVNEFDLAISAAVKMKAIFDQFKLKSFIKTSGGKGMQIYIPLPIDTFTYEETGIFTEFVCNFLVKQYPQWFTTERLKKNRGNKLYLDYVQHREGKTIIAPYSTRGNEKGLIATPLNWDEVNDSLRPEKFTINAVLERIRVVGNPFTNFRDIGELQDFKSVLNQLEGIR